PRTSGPTGTIVRGGRQDVGRVRPALDAEGRRASRDELGALSWSVPWRGLSLSSVFGDRSRGYGHGAAGVRPGATHPCGAQGPLRGRVHRSKPAPKGVRAVAA